MKNGTQTQGRSSPSVDEMVARLCEDEAWQSNLEDSERIQLIAAVQRRLENALKAEYAQLTGCVRTINQSLVGLEGSQRADVLNSLILEFRL